MAECCDNLRELFKKLKVTEELILILQEQELLDEEDLAALTDEGIERLFPNSLGKQTKLKRLRDALQGPLSKDSEVTPVTVNTDKSRQPQLFQTAGVARALQSYPLQERADLSRDDHPYHAGNFQRVNPEGPLKIFQPCLKEMFADKNKKIRMLGVGNMDPKAPTKNMMVIGETGSGKSTFIDCLFNNLLGVEFEDIVRLRLVSLAPEEEENLKKGQSVSQTEWITIYCIGQGPYHTVPYNMVIIDTPGFGDTRGLLRDQELNIQIRSFFNISPSLGINEMHAICFVLKASTTRLTATQRYIFGSVLSVFGKDIADVIFLCCTNADFNEGKPNAVNVCAENNVPFKEYFKFQNSAYFNHELDQRKKDRLHMTWDDGQLGYRHMMEVLQKTKAVSLARTVEVGQQKEVFLKQMRVAEECVQETTTKVIAKEKREKAIKDNQKSYKVFKTTKQRVPLNDGEEATNCQKCNTTCCYPCIVPNGLSYMCEQTNWWGFCRSCECWCGDHQKESIKIALITTEEEEVISIDDLAKKDATINNLRAEIENLEAKLQQELLKAIECQKRLREIALKSEVFTPEDYIDIMIEGEKNNGGGDAMERIKRYEEFKRNQKFMQELIDKAKKVRKKKGLLRIGSTVLGWMGGWI